jgi:phage gpG-like protein
MRTLHDFAKSLYRMSNQMHNGLADGVHKTATRVVANSKKRLGHYQEGWVVLKPETVRRKMTKNASAMRRMMKKHGSVTATGGSADSPLVDDGLLRGSITLKTDRHRLRSEVGSSLIYAATHEYGDESRGIPERPYLRPALKEEVETHLIADLQAGLKRRILLR